MSVGNYREISKEIGRSGETITVKGSLTVDEDFTVSGTMTFGDASTDDLIVAGDLRVNDNRNLHFGTDEDASITYDETTDDRVEVSGADWFFGTGVAITITDTLTVTGASTFNGKVELGAANGASSASGLLMGVGTTGDPATTSTADAKFIEVRAQTTATSGDNRLLYLRYDQNGAAGGGECIRAFTKATAALGTARGAHISLDLDSSGSTSGLGVGVDSQILVHNGALAGGTYAVVNSEIYSSGSSTDVSGVTNISFFRVVAGGDSTGAANVDDNAFLLDFSGVAAGSGNLIDTDITTHTAYGGLRVNIPGVGTKWIALVSA